MKLLTKKIIKALPPTMSTISTSLENNIVICKFFTPDSSWSWFVFEGEPDGEPCDNGEINYIFFGMVHGWKREMGYFKLSELRQVKRYLKLTIERDLSIFKKPYWQCS